MTKVKVKKLDERAVLPVYGSEAAAGADLYAVTDGDVTFLPGETKMIHTGLALEVPEGYAGLIYARSGLATKRGLAPANKVGVVDSDYRGEVMRSESTRLNPVTSLYLVCRLLLEKKRACACSSCPSSA